MVVMNVGGMYAHLLELRIEETTILMHQLLVIIGEIDDLQDDLRDGSLLHEELFNQFNSCDTALRDAYHCLDGTTRALTDACDTLRKGA
jgi:hypothetical protein